MHHHDLSPTSGPLGAGATFDAPPVAPNARGAPRRVGVEVEFAGISARKAAQALHSVFGGTLVEDDPHAFLVNGSGLGDLRVELDTRYVHPQAHGSTLPVRLGRRPAAWLGAALGGIVPRELITAPVAMERMPEIDRAVAVLRVAGATGRGTSWAGSFGLHFNVDPPRLDAMSLTAALKAFLLLEPWLRRSEEARHRRLRVGREAFPVAYVDHVLAPNYWPSLPVLANDYLASNPTRRRGLDLLPALLHLDEARVRAKLPYEKIGRRPVLHYRLPQARVGEAGWSMAPAWNRWLAVERLAADPDRLGMLGRTWLAIGGSGQGWMRQLARMVRASAFAG